MARVAAAEEPAAVVRAVAAVAAAAEAVEAAVAGAAEEVEEVEAAVEEVEAAAAEEEEAAAEEEAADRWLESSGSGSGPLPATTPARRPRGQERARLRR